MNRWIKRGLVVVGAVCAASLIHYYITHRHDDDARRPRRPPGSSQQQTSAKQQHHHQIAIHAPLPDPREVHHKPTVTIVAQQVREYNASLHCNDDDRSCSRATVAMCRTSCATKHSAFCPIYRTHTASSSLSPVCLRTTRRRSGRGSSRESAAMMW